MILDNSSDSTGTITGGNNDGDGGAFYIDDGTLTVIGGKIVGNKAENGGGIYIEKGYLYIDGGEISGNEAKNGGGIYWDSKNVSFPGMDLINWRFLPA